MHDGTRRAGDRVERAVDQLVARLGEHLDRHVVGYLILLYELPAEVEVRLGRRWKADLDLLEAHLD